MRKSGAAAWIGVAAVTAAVLTAVAGPVPTATAGIRAGVGAVLPVGSTETLPSAGIRMTQPADGRMWGFDYVGGVEEVGFASTAGPAGNTISAPAGGQLCVFDLVIADASVPFLESQTRSGFPFPTATVTAGTVTIPVPDADPDNTGVFQATVAVAVPTGVPVRLGLRLFGVTQTFDLRAGHRTGLDPPALYRSTTAEPYLTDSPGVTGTLTQTGPPGEFDATYSDPVNIADAYLSWFAPQPATALPPAGDAWLIVEPQGGPPEQVSDGEEYETLGLPATDVTLITKAGQRIAGQVTGQRLDDFNTDLFGGGAYYFAVPADFTGGTIDIHPAGPVAVDYAGYSGGPVTGHANITVAGAVQIPVSFPLAADKSGGAARRQSASTIKSGGHGSTVPVWVIALLVAAVVAAVGIVLWARRHPGLPARPVTRPLALVVGGAGLLAPAGVLRLGAPIETTAEPVALRELGPAGYPPAADDNDDVVEGSDMPGRSGPALVVRVLGPLQVEGLTARLRRKPARRLLICLAVGSEGALSGDQLRHALATRDDEEPSADSLRTYASALRAVLPDGVLPPAGLTGGYQLAGAIDIDWTVFRTLTARANLLAAGPDRLALIEAALGLVRGITLAGDTWAGIDPTVYDIEAAIEHTAAGGARLALDLRQARTAETVLAGGLRAVPASLTLWELRLMAAAAGSGIGLDRVWELARKALGDDARLLAATYQRLRAGLR